MSAPAVHGARSTRADGPVGPRVSVLGVCELRPFEPVSDLVILAAIDRAERHNRSEGAPWSVIVEHLGFVRGPATTRALRPLVNRLIEAGAVSEGRRHGAKKWGLTSAGRRRLTRARRAGKVPRLPESPQHRRWREKHGKAAGEIDSLRRELRDALREANSLLGSTPESADVWAGAGHRLADLCAKLAAAVFCLCEWAEPDDAQPDTAALRRHERLAAGTRLHSLA